MGVSSAGGNTVYTDYIGILSLLSTNHQSDNEFASCLVSIARSRFVPCSYDALVWVYGLLLAASGGRIWVILPDLYPKLLQLLHEGSLAYTRGCEGSSCGSSQPRCRERMREGQWMDGSS